MTPTCQAAFSSMPRELKVWSGLRWIAPMKTQLPHRHGELVLLDGSEVWHRGADVSWKYF